MDLNSCNELTMWRGFELAYTTLQHQVIRMTEKMRFTSLFRLHFAYHIVIGDLRR